MPGVCIYVARARLPRVLAEVVPAIVPAVVVGAVFIVDELHAAGRPARVMWRGEREKGGDGGT
jgi:hypothetical protein